MLQLIIIQGVRHISNIDSPLVLGVIQDPVCAAGHILIELESSITDITGLDRLDLVLEIV